MKASKETKKVQLEELVSTTSEAYVVKKLELKKQLARANNNSLMETKKSSVKIFALLFFVLESQQIKVYRDQRKRGFNVNESFRVSEGFRVFRILVWT